MGSTLPLYVFRRSQVQILVWRPAILLVLANVRIIPEIGL
jgi:hypothetical protein